ncbi:MAG TPA: DinB family protein [Gemmatimonadales bacterium]
MARDRLVLVVMAAALLPGPMWAQSLPAGTRDMLVQSLEGDRALALSMIDSMPARLLRFRPTTDVRDFAQQIDHVASNAVFLVSRFVLDAPPPGIGDSTAYLNDKDALAAAVTTAFEFCLNEVRGLPDHRLLQPTRIFGNDVPRWRVFMMVHSHDVWTMGQLVDYFRLNGMPPPAFGAF